ncbi:Hypothetical predicted protein [Lecanosticta acicola]|uniref:Uncharacterized protein n=1 Tax=Lecanosticta acicola TaxID=111012 RepID=A0AAI8YX38_9PEZI|nr:Hypothetical predicted protein [Lecanosticta acicola]
MKRTQQLLAAVALAAVAAASPAPQQLDFAQINAAPALPSGPSLIDSDADGAQTATLATSITITGVATASVAATGNANKRGIPDTTYTPYYPALATGYTTDPALSATSTTTAGQPCVTQPEAGTYCGFINPEDPCAPQPDGYGPVPTPDTASAFLSYSPLHSSARAAATTIPSVNNTQYTQVFEDLNAQVAAQSYLGLYTLQSYNVSQCAAECDATDLCTAFNIFFERDPSLNPSNNDSSAPTVWGDSCPNPPSMTSIKCTLFGSNIDASMATNGGQMREQFQVVITGSDGYDKTNITTPPACTAPVQSSTSTKSSSTAPTQTSSPGTSRNPQYPWYKPENCHGKAINAPWYSMGSRFFPGPFNPQACGDYAYFQNVANKQAGKGSCQMFNAFYLHKNNKPYGTYCSLYSAYLDPLWATNSGSSSGNDRYDCKQSWTYTFI